MPWKYGFPLLGTVAFLHWSISQSIFVTRIVSYFSDGTQDVQASYSACGFSIIAIITSLAVASVILIAFVANGFRKYSGEMPMVATCSAAISAACHKPSEDAKTHLFPVQYGVVSEKDEMKHCSFTTDRDIAKEGKRLQKGEYYN